MTIVPATRNRMYMDPWFDFPSIFDDNRTLTSAPSGLNMWEDDTHVYVEVAVPGMTEKDLDVSLENNVLSIRAARSEEEEEKNKKGKKVYVSSIQSSYYYSTTLPSNADSGSVDAQLKDGVLTVSVEKTPEAKPRKIEVKSKKS